MTNSEIVELAKAKWQAKFPKMGLAYDGPRPSRNQPLAQMLFMNTTFETYAGWFEGEENVDYAGRIDMALRDLEELLAEIVVEAVDPELIAMQPRMANYIQRHTELKEEANDRRT